MSREDPVAIETAALTKRYQGTTAVEDLTLSIPKGSVYGFLGPNGAGKSTTMQMLCSLTQPTSGSGTVLGESIEDRENLKAHIGYLQQELPLYEELSGREQLDYMADLRGLSEPESTERIESLLETFDLKDDQRKPIMTYSKGMKQKTGFIQATLHEPDVLFLDEPTAGLDPRAARTIRSYIDQLADSGVTIFLSTHILSVVDELADRVGVLNHGRLVTEGSPEMLKKRVKEDDEGTLEDVFLDVTGGNSLEGLSP